LIPTGTLAPVAGTPFDFNKPTTIGARIETLKMSSLKNGTGYDHNYVLKGAGAGKFVHAAKLWAIKAV
jgi:aldose 1-epimerase